MESMMMGGARVQRAPVARQLTMSGLSMNGLPFGGPLFSVGTEYLYLIHPSSGQVYRALLSGLAQGGLIWSSWGTPVTPVPKGVFGTVAPLSENVFLTLPGEIGGSYPGVGYRLDCSGPLPVGTKLTTALTSGVLYPIGTGQVAINGMLHFFGGDPTQPLPRPTMDVQTTDGGTPTKISSGTLPLPRGYMANCTDGEGIYIIGGMTTPDGSSVSRYTLNDFWRFDLVTRLWTQLPNFPGRVQYAAAEIISGKVYVYGGDPTGDVLSNYSTLAVYDTRTGVWTQYPYPQVGPRSATLTFQYNQKMYVVSGAARNPETGAYSYYNDVWEFTP